MIGRRFLYAMTLLGAFAVYIVNGEWLSWFLLVSLLLLPFLSLMLSLPALWKFQVAPTGVETPEMGEEVELWLLGSCPVPMPPFHGNIRIRRCFTGEQFRYRGDKGISTEHCGGMLVTVEKPRVCDYLGLFSFPPRQTSDAYILVRPKPIPMPEPESLKQTMALRWHPKPGGGYSENHELRDYHPGDSMSGIHWKLSAKTGNLIVREPMEPEQGRILLLLDLNGTPEELDRKLGRLLWMGRYLLEQQLAFELHALTGEGLMEWCISEESGLDSALNALLCQPAAAQGSVRDRSITAFWQCYIGGEPDEA